MAIICNALHRRPGPTYAPFSVPQGVLRCSLVFRGVCYRKDVSRSRQDDLKRTSMLMQLNRAWSGQTAKDMSLCISFAHISSKYISPTNDDLARPLPISNVTPGSKRTRRLAHPHTHTHMPCCKLLSSVHWPYTSERRLARVYNSAQCPKIRKSIT